MNEDPTAQTLKLIYKHGKAVAQVLYVGGMTIVKKLSTKESQQSKHTQHLSLIHI